jgi:transposase-like protein
MFLQCPHCSLSKDFVYDARTISLHGRFYRTSDSRSVERYRCLVCRKTYSKATYDPCFRQKKRQKNSMVFELQASGVSARRTARLLRLNRKTVARKLIHLGKICSENLFFQTASSMVKSMQFDDLETFEHSKCKPVSVTLAVEERTRRILSFRVARMAANGRLAKKAFKKYGFRRDDRARARKELFNELKPIVALGATIKSDSSPHYVEDVKNFFPGCLHLRVLGERGAITGQGELKKVEFDPIFDLNHTFAMFRANISRLIRKTWCTTKRIERLKDHLSIYAVYHNSHLPKWRPN